MPEPQITDRPIVDGIVTGIYPVDASATNNVVDGADNVIDGTDNVVD